MKADDLERFQDLLTDALAFWRQDVSTFALSVWWEACRPFEFEQVRKALSAHAVDPERGRFPPMPSDVVKALQGTMVDRSLIAWGKLLDAMQRVGAYNSVSFDDGAIHAAVVDMGGWPAVCRSKFEDMPHMQRRFCELHRAYSARPDIPYPPRLVGEFESTNRAAGKRVAPPLLVGDPKKAQQVMALGVDGGKTTITALDALPLAMLSVQGRAA
jgi:hypothetical protein